LIGTGVLEHSAQSPDLALFLELKQNLESLLFWCVA